MQQQAAGHLQMPQPLLICLSDGLHAEITSMQLVSPGYTEQYHLYGLWGKNFFFFFNPFLNEEMVQNESEAKILMLALCYKAAGRMHWLYFGCCVSQTGRSEGWNCWTLAFLVLVSGVPKHAAPSG